MEEKLYLIGEFASMNKVTTRMLRHYDKINLLKPMSIKENGYRYYSEKQIAIISKIKILRDCDFSLDDIAETLENDSDTFFMEQVKYKIVDLSQQARENQKAIALLEGFSQECGQSDFVNQYGISIIQGFESTLLVSSKEFDLEYVEDEFDELYAFVDKKHLTTNGCSILLTHFDEKDKEKNQVGVPVPVIKPFQDENYITIVLPKSKRISTIHYGDYYNIGYAYSSVIKFAELHGYQIEHRFIERYFIDCSQTESQNQYVTEISVPIKNNS